MLNAAKLAEAVEYNFRKAYSVGWPNKYLKVSSVLGLGLKVTQAEFATAVYDWQSFQKPLKPDGKLGPKSLLSIMSAPQATGGTAKAPDWISGSAVNAQDPIGNGPRWIQYALAEKKLWDTEISKWTDKDKIAIAERYMSRDETYFTTTPYFGGKTKPRGTKPPNKGRHHWCAAFVNWCLHAAGYSHTGSAGAHSFITRRLWRFKALTEPKKGCVIVVGNGKRASHIGFLWSSKNLPKNPGGDVVMKGGRVLQMLGGNQRGERVTIRPETKKLRAVEGYNGVTSPYLWPLQGKDTCNVDPTTEQGHYCGRPYKD